MDTRFRTVPKTTSYPLDIKFDTEGVADLINDISTTLDRYAACEKIFFVLQAYNELEVGFRDKWSFLQSIEHSLQKMTNHLQESTLNAGVPLPAADLRRYELIVWSYAELAKGYYNCAQQWDKAELTRVAAVLFQALWALSRAMRLISEVYAQPYAGYWLFCYQIIQYAETLHVDDISMGSKMPQKSSINQLFKQLLLFYLSRSNQFNGTEMNQVFELLHEFSGQLEMTLQPPQSSSNGVLVFRLNQDLPPRHLHQSKSNQVESNQAESNQDSDYRYIASAAIAGKIYQRLQDNQQGKGKPLNAQLGIRLVKMLGIVQKRKFSRIDEARKCTGIIGFERVKEYISGNAKEIGKNDFRLKSLWTIPELDLLALGEESTFQVQEKLKQQAKFNPQIKNLIEAGPKHCGKVDIWQQTVNTEIDKDENFFGDFEILNSSANGYGISCEQADVLARIGEVLGFVSDARVEIGLIHNIRISSERQSRLGVELIGFDSKVVYMTTINNSKQGIEGLFVPGEKALGKADSVIVPNSTDYKRGGFVLLSHGHKSIQYQLTKLLHATSSIKHFEIVKLGKIV